MNGVPRGTACSVAGTPEATEALAVLARMIADAPLNLVSRGERDHVYDLHVRESLAVGVALPLRDGDRWLDLGTGGGLPGLVLAIAYPEVTWVLLDSVGKKVRAVEGFVRALGVENVHVENARAEVAARSVAYRETFDGVVVRAVAPLVQLVELARGFVRDGGHLAAVKGAAWKRETRESAWACEQLGWGEARGQRIASAVRPTWLVTMRAVGPVSERFPRATGLPRRRPLLSPESRP